MANNSKSKSFKFRVAVGAVLLTCILVLALPFSSMIVSKTLNSEEIKNGIAQLIQNEDENTDSAKERADKLISNYIILINDDSKKDNLEDEIHNLVNEETMYMYFGENYTKYKDNENEIIYDDDQENIDTATDRVIKYLKQYTIALRTEKILDEVIKYLDESKGKDNALDLITEYDNAKINNATDNELNAIISKYVIKNSDENIEKCKILIDEYTDIGKELFNSAKVSNTALNLILGKDMFGNSNKSTILYFIILGIAPITAFLAVCFDNKRNIKYVISIIASILCILDITLFIQNYISYGSVISIVLYIIAIPLSILGAIAHNIEYSVGDDKKLEVNQRTLKESKARELYAQKNMANNSKKRKKKKR